MEDIRTLLPDKHLRIDAMSVPGTGIRHEHRTGHSGQTRLAVVLRHPGASSRRYSHEHLTGRCLSTHSAATESRPRL